MRSSTEVVDLFSSASSSSPPYRSQAASTALPPVTAEGTRSERRHSSIMCYYPPEMRFKDRSNVSL
ncbi:hypothetical protein E2C01_093008 [Portunus trituberculatus]|uniref:Uncharacterized protein n=1 Tax=Portunus trituberculatus TaxID=210409 RepID=A0A5B7JTE0_PORTR|nr:hypothetical protein [Portunus trituberculatus]